MSGYTFRSKGTYAAGSMGGTSGTLSPGAPAGTAVGDLLLLYAVNRNNGNLVTTPTGWVSISPGSNVTWNSVFVRIADGTATDTPTVTFTGVNGRVYADISCFTGGIYAGGLGSIVAASNDQTLPGTQTSVLYSALTIPLPNCLLIAATAKNKTSASDGTSFNAFSTFSSTPIDSYVAAGTDVSADWEYVLETSAASITAGSQSLAAPTETLQYTSILIALKSSASVNSGVPGSMNMMGVGT